MNGSISESGLSPSFRAGEGLTAGNGDAGLPPFFVGEDIGSSSLRMDAPGGRQAPESHTIIPRVGQEKRGSRVSMAFLACPGHRPGSVHFGMIG